MIYTVVGLAPCVNAVSQVQVTLVEQPNAGLPGTITACVGDGTIPLSTGLGGSPNANGTWTDLSGTGQLTGGELDISSLAPGTYLFRYTVVGSGPCAAATADVTVVLSTALDAGENATEIVCENQLVDLFTFLGGTPQAGGNWTDLDKENIGAGMWVNENNISLGLPPDLNELELHAHYQWQQQPLEGYTFQGFKNEDGSVGTKNLLGITMSVQCVSGLTEIEVTKIKENLLHKYPNVDDVVALNHGYGCGVAIQAPGAIVPIRTIKNIAVNPNFGGEIMVLGLGCEKLRPEQLIATENKDTASITYMQNESFRGFESMLHSIMDLAEKHLYKLNQRKRTTCPASDLVVGMQCGGSDAFSVITANPVAGAAADLIIRAGGSVMFSEVPPRPSGPAGS